MSVLTREDRITRESIRLDEAGLLHVGRTWVALPDIEWRVVGVLLDRFGELAARADLTRAAWPTKGVSATALNVVMKRIRHRVAPLGLHITTVRGRGFVMDAGASRAA